MLSPTAKFLALSLTGGMGRFFSDLDATVPHGRPIEEVAAKIQQVLGRHEVTLAGFGTAGVRACLVTVVVWIFALLAALVHIVSAFVMETFLFRDGRGVHQGVLAIPTARRPTVRLWAFNVGFYNLFIACGIIVGVIAWMTGNEVVGRALVIYLCLFMFLGGIVLFVADRLALSRPRGTSVSGALAQGVPPLIALVASPI